MRFNVWIVLLSIVVFCGGVWAENRVSIPNSSFEIDANHDGKPDGWRVGEGSKLDYKIKHSGKASIFVKGYAVRTGISVKPNTRYRVCVWAKRDESGLTRLLVTDAVGKTIAFTDNGGSGMPAWSGKFDWRVIELVFDSGEHHRICIYLQPKGGKQVAWYDDLAVVESPDAPLGNIFRRYTQKPDLSKADRQRGYRITAWDYMRQHSTMVRPAPSDNDEVSIFVSRGEYEPAAFSLYASKPLKNVLVKLCEPLRSKTGHTLGVGQVNILQAKYSRRWFSNVSYRDYPQFLPPTHPTTIDADRSQLYWLTIHIPENTHSGIYTGKVEIKPENAPVYQVPLTVNVWPFTLRKPNLSYGMYYERNRMPKQYRSEKYLAMYIRDMVAHGMNTLTMYDSPKLRPAAKDVDETTLDYGEYEKLLNLYQQNGLPKPGHPLLYLGAFAGGPSGSRQIRELLKTVKTKNWPEHLIYVNDEPSNPSRIAQAKKVLKQYRKANIPDMRTVTAGLNIKELGDLYDVWIMHIPGDIDAYKKAAIEKGKELMIYNCTLRGATPQHDRYLAGLVCWSYKLQGFFQWAYMHDRSKYVDDKGQWNSEPWSYGYVIGSIDGPIATPGWEARREGIDDYRYLYTLEQLAKDVLNTKNSDKHDVAKKAMIFLKKIAGKLDKDAYRNKPSGLTDFAVDFIPQPELTSEFYVRMRRDIVKYILKLKLFESPGGKK